MISSLVIENLQLNSCYGGMLTLSQTPNEFTDDNFKPDENGEKFSERGENAAGKGEITRAERFLLFLQSFQKVVYCRHLKTRACLGKG